MIAKPIVIESERRVGRQVAAFALTWLLLIVAANVIGQF